MKGKGWHLEPVRHSRARRFGSAGGKMPSKFNASGVAYSQGTQYWRTPQGKVVRVGSSPLLRAYPKIMKQFDDADKKYQEEVLNTEVDKLNREIRFKDKKEILEIKKDLIAEAKKSFEEDPDSIKSKILMAKISRISDIQDSVLPDLDEEAKPIPQKWFMVGKDLKEIAIQKPSKKKIDSLNKKGFAVSRITEIDGKTEIFTFSPRTREEAIKQENRLFG